MRRGSYDDAVAPLRPHLQNLAHRRRSAPSIAFGRAFGRTSTSIREEGLGAVPADQCPFVLGLTNENAELTLDERVQLTEGQKTKERQLFLFSDILVIAKLKASSSSYRLKHRVNLEQLWVVSFEDEEVDEEGDVGIDLRASLFLAWPQAHCVVSFHCLEVKERWLHTLHSKIKEATEQSGCVSCPSAVLMTVLSGSIACKTSGGVMDSVIEVPTDGSVAVPLRAGPGCDAEDRECHPIENTGGSKKWSHFLKKLRDGSSHSGHAPSADPSSPKALLFGQQLCKICPEGQRLPQPITDMLQLLLKKGAFTEGVFRKPANARSVKEIREQLNAGTQVELESKPVTLLAALLKDFLRQIPGSLLRAELHEAWISGLEPPDVPERTARIRQVTDRLPPANRLLLQHLLCVLHHISCHSATNKMDASNLAICIGPNLLQHSPDPLAVSKVTDLTCFLIENCCQIFGEQIQSLLGDLEEEELGDNLDSLSSHQHDSAYDSTDPDAEGESGDPPVGGDEDEPRPPGRWGDGPKPLPRRSSAPSLFLSAIATGDGVIRGDSGLHGDGLLSTSSQEDFSRCGLGLERALHKQASDDSFLRPAARRPPAPPTLRASWGGATASAASSCSLESSLSNQSGSSVFTSSPLGSPLAPRRPLFPRNPPAAAPLPPPAQEREGEEREGKEEKKQGEGRRLTEVKRRAQSMRSAGMARVRSWGSFTRGGGSLKKEPQREGGPFPCATLEEDTSSEGGAPAEPRPPRLRPRPLSAAEVFQQVDSRIPALPPPYEPALPPPVQYRALTVSGARELQRKSRPTSVNDELLLRLGPAHIPSAAYAPVDTSPPAEAPPPFAFRPRAMSESVSHGNLHDHVTRRCSLLEMCYAQESYV